MMDIAEGISAFDAEWASDSPFVAAHTSGSTGTPKEIRLPKADMRLSARATLSFFGISADGRIGAALSPEYIAGKMMIVRARESGCSLVMLPAERRPDLHGVVPLDLLAIVPAQIDGVLAQLREIKEVRNLLVGGSPMTRAQRRTLVASGIRAWESYGMTETFSHVALRRIVADENSPFEGMPGITFELDSRGCLCVVAPAFSWGRLVTNDCAELVDSRHFRWKGRYDNVIVSGGIKLHPEALEREYAPALAGMEYYVCGRQDEEWGTAAVLVVEGPEVKDLDKRIASVVANRRHLPKAIIFKERFARTSNGKLIRTC